MSTIHTQKRARERHERERRKLAFDAVDLAVAVLVEDLGELVAVRGVDVPRLALRELGDDRRELVGREVPVVVDVERVELLHRRLDELVAGAVCSNVESEWTGH